MPFAVPVALPQAWLFEALALLFFALVLVAARRRQREAGGSRDSRSRWGIIIQGLSFPITALGPVHAGLRWLDPAAIGGYAAVLLLMGGALALFARSSAALGKNWSIVARTRDDHELVRTGPYARVRHPIYLAILLVLLAMAVAIGHWLQLVIALPLFFVGTKMRTAAEERLLEQSFGETFRNYRSSTPSIIPKIGRVA
jgi:protein-S-isoprenylcysteine O-methyltransferase Ste14